MSIQSELYQMDVSNEEGDVSNGDGLESVSMKTKFHHLILKKEVLDTDLMSSSVDEDSGWVEEFMKVSSSKKYFFPYNFYVYQIEDIETFHLSKWVLRIVLDGTIVGAITDSIDVTLAKIADTITVMHTRDNIVQVHVCYTIGDGNKLILRIRIATDEEDWVGNGYAGRCSLDHLFEDLRNRQMVELLGLVDEGPVEVSPPISYRAHQDQPVLVERVNESRDRECKRTVE